MYEPKKKKYSSLTQLRKEMLDNGVKNTAFTGREILTKKHRYTMLDGIITIKER